MTKELLTDDLAKWLVPLLLAAIIFMMKRWIARSDKKMDLFADKFEQFTEIMNADKIKNAVSAQSCVDKHVNIDKDIKAHGDLLESHSKDITKIKNKIKI